MPKINSSASAKPTITLFTESTSFSDYVAEYIHRTDGDCAVVSAPSFVHTASGGINDFMPVINGISDAGGVITHSAMSKETLSAMGDSLISADSFDLTRFLVPSIFGRTVAFQGNIFEQLRADKEALLLAIAVFLQKGFEVRVLVSKTEKTLLSYLNLYPGVIVKMV